MLLSRRLRPILVPNDANAYDRPYSVGVSNAGRVLVGLDYPGTGSTVPREVNLNGDVVTQHPELGRISEPYAIRASGDRSRLALASGSRGYLVDAALTNLQTLFITPHGHNATTTLTRIDLDRFAAETEMILPVQPIGAMALSEAEDQLFVICKGGVAIVRLAAR